MNNKQFLQNFIDELEIRLDFLLDIDSTERDLEWKSNYYDFIYQLALLRAELREVRS